MAIGKPRGKNGARPVFVYDPRVSKKVYVGSRVKLNGPEGAKALEDRKAEEFRRAHENEQKVETEGPITTIRDYSEWWFEEHHGTGTRRPARATLTHNRDRLKPFLSKFGDRPIDGGIERREALSWARKHPNHARAVSAMFNDALDEQYCQGNPLANRRQEQPQGRKHIKPMTEQEVDRLSELALNMWGSEAYGLVVKALILWQAWVGSRPGETFGVRWEDLNLEAGRVTIKRIKSPYNTDTVVLPRVVIDAILAMPVQREGLVFKTVQDKAMDKGSSGYYWRPVRMAFMGELDSMRRAELLGDRPDLDLYELRHFCGSIMADRGMPARDISHQLGNTEKVCEDTYLHTHEERANERNAAVLNAPGVVSLDEQRRKKAS